MATPASEAIARKGVPANPVAANLWSPALRMRALLVRSVADDPPVSALPLPLSAFIGTLMSSSPLSATILSDRCSFASSRKVLRLGIEQSFNILYIHSKARHQLDRRTHG